MRQLREVAQHPDVGEVDLLRALQLRHGARRVPDRLERAPEPVVQRRGLSLPRAAPAACRSCRSAGIASAWRPTHVIQLDELQERLAIGRRDVDRPLELRDGGRRVSERPRPAAARSP